MKHVDMQQASRELAQVSSWVFTIQTLIFTLLIFYSNEMMGLFDASGQEAAFTLLFLCAATVIHSSFGLSELIFLYRKPIINPLISLGILLLHTCLCLYLIPIYGIIGAAASLALSYTVNVTAQLITVKKIFG